MEKYNWDGVKLIFTFPENWIIVLDTGNYYLCHYCSWKPDRSFGIQALHKSECCTCGKYPPEEALVSINLIKENKNEV